jgi:hypothetical protein
MGKKTQRHSFFCCNVRWVKKQSNKAGKWDANICILSYEYTNFLLYGTKAPFFSHEMHKTILRTDQSFSPLKIPLTLTKFQLKTVVSPSKELKDLIHSLFPLTGLNSGMWEGCGVLFRSCPCTGMGYRTQADRINRQNLNWSKYKR